MLSRVLTVFMLSLGFLLPTSEAQQVTRIPRVGFVAPQGRSLPLFEAFRQGLANLGYVDGQNILIEPRFAEGHYERFPGIFAQPVGLKVDVFAVTGAVTLGLPRRRSATFLWCSPSWSIQ